MRYCTPSVRLLLDHPSLERFRRYEQRPSTTGLVTGA